MSKPALTLAKITRTIDLLEQALRLPWGTAPGLRHFDPWTVAEGEPAAVHAIHEYYQAGGDAPPEVTMMAHVVALYGAQIALSAEGVMLLLPEGIPVHLIEMARVAGFVPELPHDTAKPYVAMRWKEL